MSMTKIEKVTDKIQRKAFEIDFLKTHTWTLDTWRGIFDKSEKGKNFAQTVIWGLFLNNELIVSLRFNRKGYFVDEDGEEYFPNNSATIGLVNEQDLSARDINAWIEHLENKGIKPAFHQLKGTSMKYVL